MALSTPSLPVAVTGDAGGKRRTFGYDGNRRLVRESWHDGGGAVIKEYTFT